MVLMTRLLVLAATIVVLLGGAESKDPNFFEKPYLQLGDRAKPNGGDLDLHWLAHDRDDVWTVEYRDEGAWRPAQVTMLRRVAVPGTDAHRVMTAPLLNLAPNRKFDYRIKVGGKEVFQASAMSRKTAAAASTRTVIFGDCAANTDGQKAVAYYTLREQPDMLFITGDIVYSRGRVSEYQDKFWPIYNAEQGGEKVGAPVLRSVLLTGVVGNHDVAPTVDFDAHPDPLGYYLYWSQPLNGPALKAGEANTPKFKGNPALQEAFLNAAGKNYPRAANFSFDYGNVHWTVLDANPYTDWTTPAFREWLKADLESAKGAAWRVVGLHHPPFNSSKAHANYQRMRVISDLLEAGGVSVVFAGHVHNYQRTFPLRFSVAEGFRLGKEEKVPGTWKLDKKFDGRTATKPDGVIYIVTGAGGAGLYNQEQGNDRASWQEFTTTFVSNIHSFTVMDASEKTLQLRQISAKGEELDRITIQK